MTGENVSALSAALGANAVAAESNARVTCRDTLHAVTAARTD